MQHTSHPAITIGRQDHAQLMKLALLARGRGHPMARFLLAEIGRARVLEDTSLDDGIVTLNKHVTYRVNFGPTKRRRLVLPEDFSTSDEDVSVLSSLGTAMLGLKERDRMPYRDILGSLHFVTVIGVDSLPPKSGPFIPGTDLGDPPDPGPQAA